MKTIGIVGGGASGMIAAITAARNGAKVTLFEKKDRVGKKLLVTGNGRCNFTNLSMDCSKYYTDNDEFLTSILNEFNEEDLIRFFTGLGLLIKEKNGYIYPACEQAATVLDLLRFELSSLGVDVLTDSNVINVKTANKGFEVETEDKLKYNFDRVILSTGGLAGLGPKEKMNGYDICKNLKMKVTKLYPALTKIVCDGANFKALAGVRSECNLFFFIDDELISEHFGEVLFTDKGISGIVTFQVSRLVGKALEDGSKVDVVLDLLPDFEAENIERMLIPKLLLHDDLTVEEFFTGLLHKKLNLEFIKRFNLKPSALVSEYEQSQVIEAVRAMKEMILPVRGTDTFENAQVTAGGVVTDELNTTMEAKNIPGLYVTGELVNVDGICGGYNLQWAFSTGHIAGDNASK